MFRDRHVMSVVHGGRSAPISVVLDSPEVRRLVALEESRQAQVDQLWRDQHKRAEAERELQEALRNPEGYSPSRKEFFEAMARAPRIPARENTRVRVLEVSKARCSYSAPEATITYLRVLVINGASKGQQAWICRNPYSLPFESP
jgi:hypothetical protein